MHNASTWRDQGRLLDILNYSEKVLSYTNDRTIDDLLADESLQLVLRSLFTIIGEAASKISEEFKQQHKQLQLPRIAGLRHRIVHDYEKVNWERVWEIIQDDLPELIKQIRPLIPPNA